jgi:peptidoglycan/xylan/chitin deacetylase (PgdA/CDA1 family)
VDKDYSKINKIYSKIIWKFRRIASKYMYRRMYNINIPCPIISFSFDDAPVTAFTNGSEILKKYGATATYYMSLGKLGLESPSGTLATYKDMINAIKENNELGCHTFDHRHSWETKTEIFLQSVIRNRIELSSLIPNVEFLSLAYPICDPKPATKKKMSKLFTCCRGGEQGFNVGPTDLNLLNAFFLDSRIGDPIDRIKMIIDHNTKAKGWLIFATHDIDNKPSKYGCSKKFLENVVRYSVQSGALLMPVGKACNYVLNNRSPH